MIKIPYGVSNFETLVTRGNYYVDRTKYIDSLENFFSSYLVFVRPRRFGKSLWISTLEYYYGLQHKDKFEQLFGQYYIGQHPTKKANQYLTLKFDFSQMDTSSFEKTYDSFLNNVKKGAIEFIKLYPQFFDPIAIQEVKEATFPAHIIQQMLSLARFDAPKHKVYLLIDEYDHFANEILSFRFEEFIKMVGRNGFVRKFYEAIKVGTHSGVLDRIFITGVSPLTLYSLASGFNITTNISATKRFSELMGFTEKEVTTIVEHIAVPADQLDKILATLRTYYNGYSFYEKATTNIYNPDMILYFVSQYLETRTYPENLLNPSTTTDYNTKIRRLFKINGKEKEQVKYLEELLKNGQIKAPLVSLFEIDERFDRKHFISLLYYMGILTIEGKDWTQTVFRMPNYVIQQVCYQYFHETLLERSQLV